MHQWLQNKTCTLVMFTYFYFIYFFAILEEQSAWSGVHHFGLEPDILTCAMKVSMSIHGSQRRIPNDFGKFPTVPLDSEFNN